jgi:predicted nucleic acid-binding protein
VTLYADGSAVLRWLFREDRGPEIERLLREATKVVCSRPTLVEVRRTIRRAVSQGQLDEVSSGAAFDAFAQAAARWAVLEVSREVADRAERPFPAEPVRTLDAIHLASALVLRHALPDLKLLSTDDRVPTKGGRLGFEGVPAGSVQGASENPGT